MAGEVDTLWVGSLANVEAAREEIPIRPDLLLDVLAVAGVVPDLLEEPAPVMKFAPDADVYAIDWHKTVGGQRVPVREVWYDRRTLRPTLVMLWHPDGRPAVRATLSDFREVEGGSEVATAYELSFPDTGSTMTLRLDNAKLTNNRVPRAASFRVPTAERAGVGQVVDLDATSGITHDEIVRREVRR